ICGICLSSLCAGRRFSVKEMNSERQIQLIREMLMCDTSGSIQLSEEQKSALAFLNRGQPSSSNAGNK
ncbi:RACGAP1 isoform 1, partial [Pongo abelii]